MKEERNEKKIPTWEELISSEPISGPIAGGKCRYTISREAIEKNFTVKIQKIVHSEIGKIETKIDDLLPKMPFVEGLNLIAQKKYREAALGLKKFLRKEPDNIDAKFILGHTYLEMDKKEKAESCFIEVIKSNPQIGNLFSRSLKKRGRNLGLGLRAKVARKR